MSPERLRAFGSSSVTGYSLLVKPSNAPCGTTDLLADLSEAHRLSLLRALLDSAADAIVAHEPDGTLVFYNRSACELLGLSRAEMAGLGPYGWVGPDSRSGAAVRLETVLHEGGLTFGSTIRRADGEVVPTEVAARRVDTEIGPLVVAVIRNSTERNDAEEHLRFLAYHDGLTGLANRAAFDERLAIAIADARRYGDLLVLAYVDLDHFKPVNDRFGHETGDAVLVEVGHRLAGDVRAQDLVARLGGDEFVILLQRVESADEIPGIAERLLANLRRPIAACGNQCSIDASVGFSVFDPDHDDARSLLVKGDVAMYAAKRDPQRKWCVYESGMSDTARSADA